MIKKTRNIYGKKCTIYLAKTRKNDFYHRQSDATYIKDKVSDVLERSFITPLTSRAGNLVLQAKSIAILHAHGGVANNTWIYEDQTIFKGKHYIPVQEWVDKNDGKYDVLFITACNGGAKTLHARKSVIVHGKKNLSTDDLLVSHINLFVFVPGRGYI